MKNSLLITAFLISGTLFAQTKVTVIVENFMFTSANITINVGDTVEWTNIQGTHNVNGTQATFSSNPASSIACLHGLIVRLISSSTKLSNFERDNVTSMFFAPVASAVI